MAAYAGTKPGDLSDALASLVEQTLPPTEVIFIKDGPIRTEAESVVDMYRDRLPLEVHALKENKGLASALNYGLQHCKQPWVARFDSDDICMHDRFEQQYRLIREDAYDLIGSAVEEFDGDSQAPHAIRKVPCRQRHIRSFCLRRNPFNHMSVCFRRAVVAQVGGYPDMPFMQDYGLWLKLIAAGARVRNSRKPTVRVRAGDGMYARRSGRAYLYSEYLIQRLMVELGLKPIGRACFDGIARGCVFVAPRRLRRGVYQRLLRRKYS